MSLVPEVLSVQNVLAVPVLKVLPVLTCGASSTLSTTRVHA